MSWIRHLPSIIASSLLFGLIGAPLGGFLFLTGLAIAWGRPLMLFGSAEVVSLAATFGAVPAFITGILAGILRIHVRSILLLAIIMAPLGALVTAIYLVVFMMTIGIGGPWIDKGSILIGAVSAFCCTFMLRRDRSRTMVDRPPPSRESVPLRYRRMRSLWAGWEP